MEAGTQESVYLLVEAAFGVVGPDEEVEAVAEGIALDHVIHLALVLKFAGVLPIQRGGLGVGKTEVGEGCGGHFPEYLVFNFLPPLVDLPAQEAVAEPDGGAEYAQKYQGQNGPPQSHGAKIGDGGGFDGQLSAGNWFCMVAGP